MGSLPPGLVAGRQGTPAGAAASSVPTLADGCPRTEHGPLVHEGVRRVATCVSGLSARDATALTLVLQLGLEPSDIATCLGVTTGAAKVIVHRARRRLRDALAVEILGRRRDGGCTQVSVLLDSGDLAAARRHVRECVCCTDLVTSEMALYRSSGALVSA